MKLSEQNKAKLRRVLSKYDSHLICYSYDQAQEFVQSYPDMTLLEFVKLMNKARDLDEQGTPYHFVGNRLYVDGELL